MKDDIIEGRLQDIPYRTSPPILFIYRQTAPLIGGLYTFSGAAKAAFTPSRPIRPNSLYIFNTFDFAMDIGELDFQAATQTIPQLSVYLQSDGGAPAFREPMQLVKYFTVMPYILNILGSEMLSEAYPGSNPNPSPQGFNFNRLLGNITGVLTQTPSLIGKAAVIATCVFSVQEITDNNFISDFIKRAEKTKGNK